MKKPLLCWLGFHKLRPVDFGNKNYRDTKHGYLEQDECIRCGWKSEIRTYY